MEYALQIASEAAAEDAFRNRVIRTSLSLPAARTAVWTGQWVFARQGP